MEILELLALFQGLFLQGTFGPFTLRIEVLWIIKMGRTWEWRWAEGGAPISEKKTGKKGRFFQVLLGQACIHQVLRALCGDRAEFEEETAWKFLFSRASPSWNPAKFHPGTACSRSSRNSWPQFLSCTKKKREKFPKSLCFPLSALSQPPLSFCFPGNPFPVPWKLLGEGLFEFPPVEFLLPQNKHKAWFLAGGGVSWGTKRDLGGSLLSSDKTLWVLEPSGVGVTWDLVPGLFWAPVRSLSPFQNPQSNFRFDIQKTQGN